MARIQKPGLDYFPLDTDFVRHRAVRKLMKAEGDAAFAVLRETFEAHAVLTSVHIQQQYLFCIRRRKPTPLHPDYCLLSPEEAGEWYPREPRRSMGINVTETPQNVALIPQSKVEKNKAKYPP